MKYDYKCTKCEYTLERSFGVLNEVIEKEDCPKCLTENAFMKQFPTGTGFILKGTGWYSKDKENK